jgi:hypothetical protein
LEDHNIIAYELELSRDSSVEINEFEFFKDLINELFIKYAPPDGGFFDIQQSEIWFALTSNQFEHDSDFKERKLGFPTQYANYKKGLNEKVSFKQLENDFSEIMGQILGPSMESLGLAIIIDEFQELSRNIVILDILRQLSEKLTGLMIVGSGLPTFVDNAVFEKFIRTSDPIHLKNFDRKESLELIFTPLSDYGQYTRFEIQHWFDFQSLTNIVMRTGGNPLHIRMLCAKIIDYYKANSELKTFELNPKVMEDVMNYYSSISDKSHRIRRALESCSREQLNAFSLIYRYEGLSIRAAILLELAFKPITAESEGAVKIILINAFRDIWDLDLFEFNKKELTIDDLEHMTPSRLSHVEFNFIGDTIDKLYATYFYRDLTNKDLIHNDGKPIEDLLSEKLADNMSDFLTQLELPNQDLLWDNALTRIDSGIIKQDDYTKAFISDLDKLRNATPVDASKDALRNALSQISNKHDLYFPAHIASIMRFEGYLIVIVEATIRGKNRVIFDFIPIIRDTGNRTRHLEQVNSISIDYDVLSQYMISIDKIYIYWLPKQPLLLVTTMDIYDEYQTLYDNVAGRNFDRAIEIGHRIWGLQTQFEEGGVTYRVHSYNNFGFCLMNINKIDDAIKIFEKLSDKFLISMVNLAYACYLKKQMEEARRWLIKIIRKQLGRDQMASFIHLCLDHPNLPLSNRIAEDVTINNVAAWNLALINSQEKRDRTIIYSYLKKVSASGNELLYHRRVQYWLAYYEGNISDALNRARKLKTDCAQVKNLFNDVCADIIIFQKELNT